ncbi:MAG TPA: hypothetical protein ENN69_02245, partial [Spirochaetia bacterium]|nr:hypothetical protein [Spirochaetia bacterium]
TKNDILFVGDTGTRAVCSLDTLPAALTVPHFLPLVAAATAAAIVMTGTTDGIGEALADFPGLPHRFETVFRDDHLAVINDSAATTPQSVCKALIAVPYRPVVLIAGGGGHKNLDYRPLARCIREHADLLILFAQDPASRRLRACPEIHSFPPRETVSSMDDAVRLGLDFLNAHGGGTLLLSPGGSGAPFFPDLFHRGDCFKACIKNLMQRQPRAE